MSNIADKNKTHETTETEKDNFFFPGLCACYSQYFDLLF